MCSWANVETALSPEVFMSLLSRFTTPKFTVRATWDPCGVVQAAAIALGLPSITHLGLTTKMEISDRDVPDLPILGFDARPSAALHVSIADHRSNVMPRETT